jgi:hypothetical protein
MASGDKRIGTSGDSLPFGTELLCVGPLLVGIAALDFVIHIPVGMGTIRVKKVRSFVTVALAGGSADSVTTIKKAAQAMTGGTLTIANAAAVADEDSCTIVNDAHARVPEDTTLVLSIAARASGSAGEALFFIEYERCQT